MKKRILVAPLNWGIGHATRCILIINWLISENFNPIIASDGAALNLLKHEFPNLVFEELPSYNIEYSKKGSTLKWKLIAQTPKMIKAKNAEKNAIKLLHKQYGFSGIISDNRLGARHKKVPSVFITHQLNVLSGNTSAISTKLHRNVMKKFDAIWIPDFKKNPNLSGKLGHTNKDTTLNIKYLGPLSRLNLLETETQYDLMVLLSGPEPQRSILEKKIFQELITFEGNILFVKGIVEKNQQKQTQNQFTIYNYMTSKDLETAINSSKLILSRSGYTTVMDLAKLRKKAFFIPTPGQFEQEYLATHFEALKLAPYCNQDDFCLKALEKVKNYKGLNMEYNTPNIKELFSLF